MTPDKAHQDIYSPRPGDPRAAAAIWHRTLPASRGGSDARRRARKDGTIRALGAFVLAAVLYALDWRIVFWIALGAGGLTLFAAWLSPEGLHPRLDRLFHGLVGLVGRVMTWLLLTPIYILVFLPFGRLFRSGRKDALRRWFEPEAATYWRRKSPAADPRTRHERQF